MNRLLLRALSLFALLALLPTACFQQDKAILVDEHDPEMNAAIAAARATLPDFWRVFDKPEHGESDFSIKLKIHQDKKGTEFFWLTDLERKDGKLKGTINNDPDIVSCVKIGDRVDIPESDISDWLYMRNEKMVGNRTMVPLFKKLPPDEVARFKSMMVDP